MRMVALVRPSEMEVCKELCGSECDCAPGEHHREYGQRNIAAHAHGKHDILFAHADMWINLHAVSKLVESHGNSTMTPLTHRASIGKLVFLLGGLQSPCPCRLMLACLTVAPLRFCRSFPMLESAAKGP